MEIIYKVEIWFNFFGIFWLYFAVFVCFIFFNIFLKFLFTANHRQIEANKHWLVYCRLSYWMPKTTGAFFQASNLMCTMNFGTNSPPPTPTPQKWGWGNQWVILMIPDNALSKNYAVKWLFWIYLNSCVNYFYIKCLFLCVLLVIHPVWRTLPQELVSFGQSSGSCLDLSFVTF